MPYREVSYQKQESLMGEHAPAATPQDDAASSTPVSLWNPEAAAMWSLVFSPAFGAYLHMRNWQQLGQKKKAAESKLWFLAATSILALDLALTALNATRHEQWSIPTPVSIALLLGWYIWSARGQRKYLANERGNDYVRKPWSFPLLIAVAATVAYGELTVLVQAAADQLKIQG
jgi:hypothetical protein